LQRLYEVGVRTGSIERRDRRKIGVQCDIAGSTRLWRIVGISRGAGQIYDGRARRFCESERLGSEMGVRISLDLLVSQELGNLVALT
jgi:hypothetical protein